jgi:hypothetical protein
MSTQHLELAIAILEFAIRRSKYRYQIRTLLIRLYKLAGAPDLAMKHYQALEPKQIQLDSLGFWGLERGSMFSSNSSAGSTAGKEGGQTVLGQKEDRMGMLEVLERVSGWYEQADNEVSCTPSRSVLLRR